MTQEEFHKRYQYNPTSDCLGEGGFGKVYKAYDTHLDKWVAIKIAEVKQGLEQVRLKHEVELVNKLTTHANIASYEACYTFSSFTGEYDFAVLQYYELGNLQQLLTNAQLSVQQKESILHQILAGIDFLHKQGIIHRDLKPQNILIVNRNGEYVPKITDFGISKKLDINKSSVFTNSLAGAGTLSYASPEQLCGFTIRKNTDLWSYGVIVCQVLLGKLPFNTGSGTVTNEAGRNELYKQITNGVLDPSVNQLSAKWQNLVRKCIVVKSEERIGNAAQCLELLSEKQKQNAETVVNKSDTRTDTIDEGTKDVREPRIIQSENKEILIQAEQDTSQKYSAVLWIGIAVVITTSVIIFISYNKNDNFISAGESKTEVTADTVQIQASNEVNNASTSNVSTEPDVSATDQVTHAEQSTTVNSSNPGTVTDIDGNIYKTVIGNQVWMAENLKTTHYNDGSSIPNITDNTEWTKLRNGAYCWYDNNIAYKSIYGALYNWYAVDTRKLAPTGWHLPTDTEWAKLTKYLGGRDIAGGELKEYGTSHWNSPNTGATNATGFSALPGGYRSYYNGSYDGLGTTGYWWTATENNPQDESAYGRGLYYGSIDVSRGNNWHYKPEGNSVRCIKD